VKIGSSGRVIAQFDAIPDLPLRELRLSLNGGAKGVIQLSPAACTTASSYDATFTGQGGQTANGTVPAPCPLSALPKAKSKLSTKTGLSLKFASFGGHLLTSAKVTLPKGFSINKNVARHKGNLTIKIGTVSAKAITSKVSHKSGAITPKKRTGTSLTVRLAGKAISRSSHSTKAKTVKIKARFAFADGGVLNQTISVKAK